MMLIEGEQQRRYLEGYSNSGTCVLGNFACLFTKAMNCSCITTSELMNIFIQTKSVKYAPRR